MPRCPAGEAPGEGPRLRVGERGAQALRHGRRARLQPRRRLLRLGREGHRLGAPLGQLAAPVGVRQGQALLRGAAGPAVSRCAPRGHLRQEAMRRRRGAGKTGARACAATNCAAGELPRRLGRGPRLARSESLACVRRTRRSRPCTEPLPHLYAGPAHCLPRARHVCRKLIGPW